MPTAKYLVYGLLLTCNSLFSQLLPPPPLPPGQTSTECVVNLQITDYSSHGKKYKVVISGPQPNQKELIKYKAKSPNKPPGDIKWEAGHDSGGVKGFFNYWGLVEEPVGSEFQLEGMCTIPNIKMPLSNTDLGNAHGMVMVTENDVYPGATISDVEVFFRKDDRNFNNVPNWFFYWSQIPTEHKGVTNIKFYDPVTNTWVQGDPLDINMEYTEAGKYAYDENKDYMPGEFVTYGTLKHANTIENIGTEKIGPSTKGAGAIPYLDGNNYGGKRFIKNLYIAIGKGCGYKDVGNETITGISVFSENFYHEMEHWKIFYENWKDGYQTDLDLDHDGYNDNWESTHNSGLKPFKINHNDAYGKYTLPLDPYDPNLSAGTYYEEKRCRDVQILFTNTLTNKDWSYDPTKKYQGKQWE